MAVLDDWYNEILADGKIGWLGVYHKALNQPISNPVRFFEAVDQYGDFPMFEAIIATASKSIDGDPLNYVLAVANNKWIEEVKSRKAEEAYKRGLERTKRQSYEKSMELADKIRRAQDA